jgi:hypothetical protein
MDPDLVDRIYESSFVPELWPGVLDELGRIAEGTGGELFITKADVQYWTTSPEARERAERFVNEGWLWRGQAAARFFAARHAGFLTWLDIFTPDELDLEPVFRDYWRPLGISSVGIPIPTGENVILMIGRLAERGPFERAIVHKLDEASQRNARRHGSSGAGSQRARQDSRRKSFD